MERRKALHDEVSEEPRGEEKEEGRRQVWNDWKLHQWALLGHGWHEEWYDHRRRPHAHFPILLQELENLLSSHFFSSKQGLGPLSWVVSRLQVAMAWTTGSKVGLCFLVLLLSPWFCMAP